MNLGILLVHSIVLGSIILSFLFENLKESKESSIQPKESLLTISKDTLNNSFSAINENGETLYLKSNDSVFINKIDQE